MVHAVTFLFTCAAAAVGALNGAAMQSGNPDVLSDWPHALHLFGHIYNGDL